MFKTLFGRLSATKAIAVGLAVALIAGLVFAFAGDVSAARAGKGKAAASCIAVLRGAGTLDTALSELVKDGTLTQTQADAVKAKVAEDSGGGAKACVGLAILKQSGVAPAVEKLLGMTGKEISADYKSGKSLTEIAASKNVDRATLVSTIETAINGEIDKLVANGKLSATQAATIKTDVAAKVEKAVDLHKGSAKPGVSATPQAMATPAA